MKICYLTYNLDKKNGWGRYSSDLIGGVKNFGFSVEILKEKEDNLEGVRILDRGIRAIPSMIKSLKYIKNCDLIHAMEVYPYGLIAWVVNLFFRKKLIISAQGTYAVAPLHSRKIGWLVKQIYRSVDKIIAISDYTSNEILRKVEPKSRPLVIQHGIDLNQFHAPRQESDDNFILSVGALKYRKGYHISIPAFAAAKKQIPNLRYKIVGNQNDVNYFKELLGLVEIHDVKDSVDFLLDITDKKLRSLYQTAQLFILTSVNQQYHFEGFGLVFLEAAAAGLPCIGTTGNGIQDAVNDGYNGLLVPQNDIIKTSEAIEYLLNNPKLKDEFSKNSYQWAQDHDLTVVVNKYIECYKEVLSK